ncbi:GNAT family N-acetyltransferase [Bordetella flabilis]|uniref:GNAT family N-acetyltransferase n=1 Tax=Bordetella flabilis TaxID=463014 RepID=UPI000AB70EE0|nr:GNAT family N-acetyltransferase [Bordetella flabilis]
MTICTHITGSLGEIDDGEYQSLFERCGSPLFYDRRFLLAAEQSPLLPVRASFYITIRKGGRIVAFLPAYLQDIGVVDPLGLLATSAKISNVGGNGRGVFSHIMHCADSSILTASHDSEVYAGVFAALNDIARQEGASYFGLLNVQDGPVLREAERNDLNVNYMVDRYCVDLSRHDDFDAFVQALPADGRHEMTRQLRKFERSNARAHILAPPFGDKLEQLSELCQVTTARNGTPQYWPAKPLARFAGTCGDLVRLSIVEVGQDLVSGFICFEEPHAFHIWSAGMVYDRTDFSPYTLGVATAYRHAFARGIRRVECGRLNAKIKTRLGLHPVRLYAITSWNLS